MLIDEAKIYVKGGRGGDGCSSLFKDIFHRKGVPDGGDGGSGGNVVLLSDTNLQTLLDFKYNQHHRAGDGGRGGSNHKQGKRGKDLIVKVPVGTIIKDAESGLVMRDLSRKGEEVVIARGGAGGKGNSRGREATSGSDGEEKTLFLELKLVADAGIIGFPNAGKSTLVSRISSAHPKIANYPFTTIEPVLGVVKMYDDAHFVVAEIPGLIEGAHEGKGLGDRFLRHVERTKVLIHLVDIAACEGRDPLDDFVTLNRELASYSKELAKKPQVIALNKTDLPDAKKHIARFRKRYPRKKVYPLSGVSGDGIKALLDVVYKQIKAVQ